MTKSVLGVLIAMATFSSASFADCLSKYDVIRKEEVATKNKRAIMQLIFMGIPAPQIAAAIGVSGSMRSSDGIAMSYLINYAKDEKLREATRFAIENFVYSMTKNHSYMPADLLLKKLVDDDASEQLCTPVLMSYREVVNLFSQKALSQSLFDSFMQTADVVLKELDNDPSVDTIKLRRSLSPGRILFSSHISEDFIFIEPSMAAVRRPDDKLLVMNATTWQENVQNKAEVYKMIIELYRNQ